MELFDTQGRRLYLAVDERTAFLDAAKAAPRGVRTFCLVLVFTGFRICEPLQVGLNELNATIRRLLKSAS